MGQLDIFGSETYEYLFIIEPDQKTSNQVIQLRNHLKQFIPLPEETLHSKPHISLCYFEASDFSDDHILAKARQVFSLIPSFPVHTDNCEQWKNGTFILKIKEDQFTLMLQEQLSTVFKGVIKNLHLTIARNVPTDLLEQISMKNFRYMGNFDCNSILLLKKKGDHAYQLLEKISLGNH